MLLNLYLCMHKYIHFNTNATLFQSLHCTGRVGWSREKTTLKKNIGYFSVALGLNPRIRYFFEKWAKFKLTYVGFIKLLMLKRWVLRWYLVYFACLDFVFLVEKIRTKSCRNALKRSWRGVYGDKEILKSVLSLIGQFQTNIIQRLKRGRQITVA